MYFHTRKPIRMLTNNLLNRILTTCLLLLATPGLLQAAEAFDHFTTGFPLTGKHEFIDCSGCHIGGQFKGTPLECGLCHNNSRAPGKHPQHIPSSNFCDDCHTVNSWTGARFDHSDAMGECVSCHNSRVATGKTPNHILTTPACDDCHNTITFSRVSRMDHGAVIGVCDSCHNGFTATGKPPSHLQTSAQCDDCHNTINWRATRFDHSNITAPCSSCHNGSTATGKPPGHIQTVGACDDCHNTNSWLGANFDHSGVTGLCSSCHNGSTATGKPPGHVQTTGECDACHSTSTWVGASFDHNNVTGLCSSCHNGSTSTGKPATHFVTTLDCDRCHYTTRWVPLVLFRHDSPDYPGDHRTATQCVDCHTTNNQTIAWKYPAYKPECAGCHANDYRQGEHRKTDNPQTYYTVSELRDCSGACHIYTDTSLTTISRTRNSQHRASGGGF